MGDKRFGSLVKLQFGALELALGLSMVTTEISKDQIKISTPNTKLMKILLKKFGGKTLGFEW